MTKSRIAITATIAIVAALAAAASLRAESDKIAFPNDYTKGVVYKSEDRPDNKQVRELFITREAVEAVHRGAPLPSGTVITSVRYAAQLDAQGNPAKDADGRSIETDKILGSAGDHAAITGVHWGRNAFGYEPLPSGPQPVTNLKRRRDGTSDGAQLVGNYDNPVLKPAAGAVVKQKGELAIAGKGFPNESDQCRPYAPPFTFAMQLSFQMLQKSDGDITIIYNQDDNVRHIRMNATHPINLVPSPMGDAVGHWEGETLVIDTVGIEPNAFTAADMYGTPQSAAMHVIERYRLIDGALAKAAQDNYEKVQGVVAGRADPDTRAKGLRLELMMEDPEVFAAPLPVHVTYRRLLAPWQEQVCAENPVEHYEGEWIGLPRADHPDF